MSYDIKKILKEREENYIKKTEEILMGFFQPLKKALEDVIYGGEKITIVIKGLRPITQNLNYISLSISAANYEIGDLVPVEKESEDNLFGDTEQITEENFWKFADTINLNIPISVLETKDETTMIEFLEEVYDHEIPIPDDDGESAETIEDLLKGKTAKKRSEEKDFINFDENSELDDAQRTVFDLYNSKGRYH